MKSHVLLGKFGTSPESKRLHGLSFPKWWGKRMEKVPFWPLKTADDGPDGKGGLR